MFKLVGNACKHNIFSELEVNWFILNTKTKVKIKIDTSSPNWANQLEDYNCHTFAKLQKTKLHTMSMTYIQGVSTTSGLTWPPPDQSSMDQNI